MFKHRLIFSSRHLAFVLVGQLMALVLSLSPAWSLDSGWAETEGGRMRLVIDPVPRADGAIAGFLDIALDPGWKTYWLDPGSAGIPPMLDFSQSRGIVFEAMEYPPPVRVDDGYAIWAGYTAPVQLPLTFRRTASGDAQLHALAFIGICEKVCIPFQAELVVDLPAELIAQDMVKPAVDNAFARLPEPAGPDFNIEEALFNVTRKQLTISTNLPAFRPSSGEPELFVAGPQGYAFAPPQLSRDEGGLVTWSVRVESLPEEAADSNTLPLELVVTLGQRAMGQSVSVDLAAPN